MDHKGRCQDESGNNEKKTVPKEDEVIYNKQSLIEEEKCNIMQTVDLSDLTFSSFNDFLLGDCSYFEDISVNDSSNDFVENNSNKKQLSKNSIATILQGTYMNESSQEPKKVVSKISLDNCEDDNFIKKDNYNFYHVFEIIENPITREKDLQKQITTISKMKCKSHKTPKHKKKRKIITCAIRKGQRYLPSFKQKVLDYTKSHTFKATALHFNINCNTITEWARESKRLLQQQKSTSMPSSVCHYKTEIVNTLATKTDNKLNDSFRTQTDLNDSALRNIEQDLPLGDMRSDERFLKWIVSKRSEKKELTRNEVYYAAQYCLQRCTSTSEKSVWFSLWLKRFDEVLKNSEKSDQKTEKYIMYPNSFKVEVALYAKLFTKNSAARVFNVPRRRIFDWFKCSDSLNNSVTDLDASNNCTNINPALYIEKQTFNNNNIKKEKPRREIYAELHNWYKQRFSEGFSPTSNEKSYIMDFLSVPSQELLIKSQEAVLSRDTIEIYNPENVYFSYGKRIIIREKAREMFDANGIRNLKFSEGWLQKFCKRLNIKLRHTDDDRLLLWILAQFDNNKSLSHQEITEKSSKIIGNQKVFKGSKGWTLRFLKRHSNFLQQIPTFEDKLPDIVQSEINEFCTNIKYSLKSQKIPSSNIGCLDEIPIGFNYPQDGKSNLPLLRKTGFENCQAIVFLCMLANGRMLPPAVVLRGNSQRQILSDGTNDIVMFYQEHGIIDFDTVQNWVGDIWLSCISSPSILIVDSFKTHSSEELKEKLAKENCTLAVIPEGCSSRLQPLNVEITPKFIDLIKEQWKELQSNEIPYSTKVSNRCRCPDQDTILRWIRNAYRNIEGNPYSIINSFKVVGVID